MAESKVELRTGSYHDSVSLMQVSRTVAASPGVQVALVAMATELNVELLTDMGFAAPEAAGPGDLLVAIRAEDGDALQRARQATDAELEALSRPDQGAEGGTAAPARTVPVAAARVEANLALISVPGEHAYAEALDALEAGLSVMIFSDNVPVQQEVDLKERAATAGLLVMGPDCGTAVVSGVGLGFANVVRPGPVGIVAASGTGAQQLMCLLDAAGVGITHCLGLGGRDLSERVGARSALSALEALDADEATELIVLVSKPAPESVAARVRERAASLGKPVVFALLGEAGATLTAAAAQVLAARGRPTPAWPTWAPAGGPRPARPGALRGLFSGGTLCDEAMTIAAERLGPIRSNIPLDPDWALPADLRAPGHLMIDFGDDRLTRGRAHPMIDQTLRLERLAEELAAEGTGVVLLDVVLGHGAHPDPAGELAPVLAGSATPVVVSLCGTAGDPQGLAGQATALAGAGAEVFLSNAEAAARAVELAGATVEVAR